MKQETARLRKEATISFDRPLDWRATRVVPLPKVPVTLNVSILEDLTGPDLADWDMLTRAHGWGMAAAPLAVQQEALAGQGRVWFALVRGESGKPLAAAALARLTLDLVQSPPRAARLVGQLRRVAPSLMKSRVLFCGLPVPCGSLHLAVAPDVDADAVFAALDASLRRLARRERARFIVWKEFDPETTPPLSALENLGYAAGPVPPMHHLVCRFSNLEDYRQALRQNYRRQLDASLVKASDSALSVESFTDPAAINAAYDDAVHDLYTQVWRRSVTRLEWFPAHFFRALPAVIHDPVEGTGVVLTLLRLKGEPAAMAYGVLTGTTYQSLYIGVDYARNRAADLYFNVFLASMDRAWQLGAHHILLGQTADTFKSRLGAVPEPLSCYVKATNPVIHRGLRLFRQLAFPVPRALPVRRVFRETENAQDA